VRAQRPLIPYGAGSSLEGHLLAVRGGVSLDLSEMNRVLAINAEDLTVTVEPGITRKALNEALRDTGLFFPIDPGADASIGGMTATRASGTNAVRYGTMRENVLGLSAVLADGRVVKTGSRARKSSAGYDLTRLFVGSEGTLGVITEITLRLHPLPEAVSAAICAFPTMGDAVRTVIETIQIGVPIARVEFVDALAVRSINRHSNLTLAEAPTLFFEFHGTDAGVKEQAELVQALAGQNTARASNGRRARGPHAAVGRAPQRVLRDAAAQARLPRGDDRRLRADLAAGRLRRGNRSRPARVVAALPDRRPRRRRQFPRRDPDRPRQARRARRSRTHQRPDRRARAAGWAAPAPANTASACTRCASCRRSTARTRSTRCGRSSSRSIRAT
jgi:FAD/FMN-containing dehydrogenase